MPFLKGDQLPPNGSNDGEQDIATADALAAFRDELSARGFGADEVRVLVRIALAEEARKYGISIRAL